MNIKKTGNLQKKKKKNGIQSPRVQIGLQQSLLDNPPPSYTNQPAMIPETLAILIEDSSAAAAAMRGPAALGRMFGQSRGSGRSRAAALDES